MGDMLKAAQDALFGAWNWLAENLATLQDIPEEVDRLPVVEELLRAYTHLVESPETALGVANVEEATRAADIAAMALVELEEVIPAPVLARLAPVRNAREALLETVNPQDQAAKAPEFLRAFEAAWERDRAGLIFDASLAAVVHHNLLAPLAKDPKVKAEHLARAAALYDQLAGELGPRAAGVQGPWAETVAQAVNRAAVARRALAAC